MSDGHGILRKTYSTLLLVIFLGVLFHAPISVGLGTLFPDISLAVKAWKEILLILAAVVAGVLIFKNKRQDILKDPLLIVIVAYGVLHLVMSALIFNGWLPVVAGLLIDLRYLLFFGLVYVFFRLYPDFARRKFVDLFWVGGVAALGFVLLQAFVLPVDFLSYVGYGANTIAPYLTVDESMDFIRLNGTFRGPNPLGAYAVIALSVLLTFTAANYKFALRSVRGKLLFGVIFTGGLVALWASYSRSAALAFGAAVLFMAGFYGWRKFGKKLAGYFLAGLLAFSAVLALVWNTPMFSYIVLHENPSEINDVNSNDGHLSSLESGLNRALAEPLGKGVGAAGSASLLGDRPLIIENQYLYIAHEVGWLGLGLFLLIFVAVMKRLWHQRSDWLSLGVFASGLGMAIIGLLLPVWADDTVSIVWWGLAGLAIGSWKLVDVRRVTNGG